MSLDRHHLMIAMDLFQMLATRVAPASPAPTPLRAPFAVALQFVLLLVISIKATFNWVPTKQYLVAYTPCSPSFRLVQKSQLIPP